MLTTTEHVRIHEGEYYVAHTRVPIGVIIAAWKHQTPPEHIVEQFPPLSLADVYGAITYYLDHQQALEAHFSQLRTEYDAARMQSHAADPARTADLRQRRDAWRQAHPKLAESYSQTEDQESGGQAEPTNA